MQLLMSLLGSPVVDQQEVRQLDERHRNAELTDAQTASRTLGELCRKNGERIFGEIIPILQKAISSPDERTKEGACLAFADVMSVQVLPHWSLLIRAGPPPTRMSSPITRTPSSRPFVLRLLIAQDPSELRLHVHSIPCSTTWAPKLLIRRYRRFSRPCGTPARHQRLLYRH